MPDFVTHHIFGEQMLSVFPASVAVSVAKRPTCFNWGLQGPDPLYFHKLMLGSPLHALGNKVHTEKTDELFFALSRAVSHMTGTNREIAEAFFYGFLCHYVLDSRIHPYIYCRQSEVIEANPHLNCSAVHCQLESDIDYALYEHIYGTPVTNFDPKLFYNLTDEEAAVLGVLLHCVLNSVYGQRIETTELRGCFREMLSIECFLYSNRPGIYRSAQRLERIIKRGALLTSHMKSSPDWDALNEAHTPWCNLWEPAEEHTESIFDLLALARIQAASLAGQYSAQFDSGWLLLHRFECPFDAGNPKLLSSIKKVSKTTLDA